MRQLAGTGALSVLHFPAELHPQLSGSWEDIYPMGVVLPCAVLDAACPRTVLDECSRPACLAGALLIWAWGQATELWMAFSILLF